MKKTGIADNPLHYGKAPSWLFQRMKRLAREIIIVMVHEFGAKELLKRISDPYWFQALGSVLGFDWHSSGLTTTVCGAMKEGIRGIEKELGFFIAGGKGKAALKTPDNIVSFERDLSVNPEDLIYASRMSAKVDNTGIQDGYAIYHHSFFFTKDGEWSVVQQGMNEITRYARRYHWLGMNISGFTCEPHTAICASRMEDRVLNMVAREGQSAREASTIISREKPDMLVKELKTIQTLSLPVRHQILARDINPDRLYKTLLKTYETQSQNFETLLGIQGVGPKTIRAIALLSELIYGAEVSFRDPARFSFAHGGKDGHPYPVNRKIYDSSIELLKSALVAAKIGDREKIDAIKRLKDVKHKQRPVPRYPV